MVFVLPLTKGKQAILLSPLNRFKIALKRECGEGTEGMFDIFFEERMEI
jgi:hypothetical protein